jgi:hypothetical protein
MLEKKPKDHEKKASGKTFANLEHEFVQFKLLVQML